MNLTRTLNKNQFYNKPQLYVIMLIANNWKMNCKVAVYNSKEFEAPCVTAKINSRTESDLTGLQISK